MRTPTSSPSISRRKRAEQEKLTAALDVLCAGMQPGDVVPTHTELMRRYGASERAVLRALEELQRTGRIVRYQGKGTFIAEREVEPQAQPVLPEVISDSKTIVAILRPDHSFFDRCLDILFHQARAAGLAVACRLVESGEDWCPADIAERQRPAGFIVFSARLAPIARRLQAAGHRVVIVGQPLPDQLVEVPLVYGDQEQGGYMAMRHLIELGHRRIAYCNFDGTQGLRGAGHERALREWNMCLGSTVSPRVGFGEAGADQRHPARAIEIPGATFSQWLEAPHLMAEYFQSPDAPTGLLAWNDHRALMILGMLSRAGLRVPEQVSLMGYDALPEGQMVHPALTTLSTQIEQQVQLAMGLLTRPAPTPAGHSVVLVPSLVPGETTQRAPKSMF